MFGAMKSIGVNASKLGSSAVAAMTGLVILTAASYADDVKPEISRPYSQATVQALTDVDERFTDLQSTKREVDGVVGMIRVRQAILAALWESVGVDLEALGDGKVAHGDARAVSPLDAMPSFPEADATAMSTEFAARAEGIVATRQGVLDAYGRKAFSRSLTPARLRSIAHAEARLTYLSDFLETVADDFDAAAGVIDKAAKEGMAHAERLATSLEPKARGKLNEELDALKETKDASNPLEAVNKTMAAVGEFFHLNEVVVAAAQFGPWLDERSRLIIAGNASLRPEFDATRNALATMRAGFRQDLDDAFGGSRKARSDLQKAWDEGSLMGGTLFARDRARMADLADGVHPL